MKNTSYLNIYLAGCATTIFAQSDAATTIYLINQFCAATIWEWCSFNSLKNLFGKHRYKGLGVLQYQQWINTWWLGFGAKLSASWSAVAFRQSGTYTVPPIHFLVFFCQGGRRGVGGEQSCFWRLLVLAYFRRLLVLLFAAFASLHPVTRFVHMCTC